VQVQVSGQLLDWPHACACCGQAPDNYLSASFTRKTGQRVKRTDTRAWQIPYCARCARHVRMFSTANSVFRVGLILCAVVSLVLLLSGRVPPDAFWGTVVLALLILLLLYTALRVWARLLTGADCSSVGPAVRYRGWDASVHSFSIANSEFGEAFIVANRRKVLGQPASGEIGPRQFQTRLRVERRGPRR
jgi:hypothetical protein